MTRKTLAMQGFGARMRTGRAVLEAPVPTLTNGTPSQEGFVMAHLELPCPDVVRQLIDYDPESGQLTWRPRDVSWFSPAKNPEKRAAHWNRTYAGRPAFGIGPRGYVTGTILYRTFLGHRVAWAIHYGCWPSKDIDHINRNRADNRICNLRETTQEQNCRNMSVRSDNKVGISGLWSDKKCSVKRMRWSVVIGSKNGLVYKRKHHCFGVAIRDRNAQYRARGFTAGHGQCNPSVPETWKSLGDLARALAERGRDAP